MIPSPDIGFVYPKTGLDADLRFDSTPRFVSTGSMFLDGVDDCLNLDGLTFTTSSANYSFTCWVKSSDSTADKRIFGVHSSTSSDRINIYWENASLRSYTSDGASTNTFVVGDVSLDGVWCHFALTVGSGTSAKFYIDGQLVGTDTQIDIDMSACDSFIVGAAYDENVVTTLAANICHFGVWHDELSQSEIRALMTANTYAEAITKGGSTPRAYYLLEADADDSVGTQDGALTNGAVIVGDRARLPNGYDLTGNQLNAVPFSGRAWAGDGTGDKIVCGTALGDDLGDNYSGSFSVSFWAKNSENDGSNNDGVHELNGAGASNHGTHAAYYFNSTIRFALDGNAWYRACDLVGVEWHHFVMVYTAGSESDSKVYIDGLEVSGTTSGTFPAAADLDFAGDTLHLGLHYDATTDLNGSIADWKFFKIALTAAQALELYEVPEQVLPTGATAANLRSWYPLADYDIASANNLNGLYVQDSGALGAPGLCTNGGMEFSQPNIPQLGLRSSSSRILFDGSDDKVTVAANAAIDGLFGAGGSVSAWIMPFSDGESSEGRIVDTTDGSGYKFDVRLESAGVCGLNFYHVWTAADGDWKTSSTTVNIGSWNHVAVTYNGAAFGNAPVFYVNGSLVATTENTGPGSGESIEADNGIKVIGNNSPQSRTFDGIISEVAFYKGTILDADAITVMYNSGIQGFDLLSDSGNYDNSGDVDGWWKLDNPVTIQDLTANDNDGTVSGAPNMATVPEGTTADLSVFGTLTNKRYAGMWNGKPCATSAISTEIGNVCEMPALPWGTANFTIHFWYRLHYYPGDNTRLFDDREDHGVSVWLQSNTVTRFYVDGTSTNVDGQITVTAAQQIGTWVQLVLRREGSSTFSYVVHPLDQSAVSTTDSTGTDPGTVTSTSDYGMKLGGGSDLDSQRFGNPCGAQFAFFRCWQGTAITDAEVDALYESGARMLRGT